jgi:hypothetical protein
MNVHVKESRSEPRLDLAEMMYRFRDEPIETVWSSIRH